MGLVVLLINLPDHFFAVTIFLDLLSQLGEVRNVVFLFQLVIVLGDDVLLLLLPAELLTLKVSNVFYLFAFFLEAQISLVIDFLKVRDILLSLSLSMVINFERSLRSKEIRIGVIVIAV